jgi:uncharacterized protein
MANNPYILAADNSPALLPLLRSNPALASGQDEHGYSLVHAAASYNHLELLKTLINEFGVNINLRDEDGETALFVVETVEAAQTLVNELNIDVLAKNSEGQTACEKISEEGDFLQVAEYLRGVETARDNVHVNGNGTNHVSRQELPSAPEGMTVSMSTIAPAEDNDETIDPEFRRRIEQLAEREDFHTEQGQAELRQLVQDAIADSSVAERNVRPRQE